MATKTTKSGKKWSAKVTNNSDALDLEKDMESLKNNIF